MLIRVAIMIYDNTTISEEDGKEIFKDFFREEQMQKVFITLTTLRKMTKMNKSLLILSKIENDQFNRIEIIECIFYNHNKIKLENKRL